MSSDVVVLDNFVTAEIKMQELVGDFGTPWSLAGIIVVPL